MLSDEVKKELLDRYAEIKKQKTLTHIEYKNAKSELKKSYSELKKSYSDAITLAERAEVGLLDLAKWKFHELHIGKPDTWYVVKESSKQWIAFKPRFMNIVPTESTELYVYNSVAIYMASDKATYAMFNGKYKFDFNQLMVATELDVTSEEFYSVDILLNNLIRR